MTHFYHPLKGMQTDAIRPAEPRGLPLHLKTMPEYFRDLGYETHMIGKVNSDMMKRTFLKTSFIH